MTDLAGARVVVAGAGAVGSAIAMTLAQAGADVFWSDPGAAGDNASGVAAGMLSPAFETVLDPTQAGSFDLLKAGRDLWPDLTERLGDAEIGLRRSGALWVDAESDASPRADSLHRGLSACGAAAEIWSANQIRREAPGLRSDLAGGLFTPEDWRLDPALALGALHDAAVAAGARKSSARLTRFENRLARLSDGRIIDADWLILATGADEAGLAPELSRIAPIKGQILHYPPDPAADGRLTIRCPGGYASPGAGGMTIGATMEPGLRNRLIDSVATDRLSGLASSLFPHLAGVVPIARAGVRAATPDGLPLVGPSVRPGVLLAAGMRRNGWLLAPLVAAMTAAYLTGGDPGAYAAPLDARRFGTIQPG